MDPLGAYGPIVLYYLYLYLYINNGVIMSQYALLHEARRNPSHAWPFLRKNDKNPHL